jgi:hypothetical protein
VSGFREEEMGVVMADGALPWTAPVRLPFHLTYYYRRKKTCSLLPELLYIVRQEGTLY